MLADHWCHTNPHVPALQPATTPEMMIVDVWADDLEAAFVELRQVVVHYPMIAMDTEFPA
eukprot:gene4309-2455_t